MLACPPRSKKSASEATAPTEYVTASDTKGLMPPGTDLAQIWYTMLDNTTSPMGQANENEGMVLSPLV